MVTENSTSGSGSPDISTSSFARDDRRDVVSQSTAVVAYSSPSSLRGF